MSNSRTLEAVVSIAGVIDASLSKALSEAGKQFGHLKAGAVAVSTAVIAGVAAVGTATIEAGKYLIDLGTEFDSVYDTIRIGTGATGEALAALNDDFKEVYSSVPASMEDAGQAIADYNTRLGLTGPQLQEVSKQALQVSDMLGDDLGSVIEESSQAFQAWGISANDMSAAMDYVFKASQSTGMGFTALLNNVQQMAPQLQDMGYSFEEATALLGQLDKAGVNTNEVLSAMKKSVGTLAKDGLSASEGLEIYADKIKNAKDMTEAITIASEIFGSKAGSTMAAAIRDGTLSVTDLTAELKASSETIAIAAEDTYSFTERMQLFKQQAQVALEPIASTLFDSLNDIMPLVGDAMKALMPIIEDISITVVPVIKNLMSTVLPVLGQKLISVLSIFQSAAPIILQISGEIMPILSDAFGQIFMAIGQLQPVFAEIISNIMPMLGEIFSQIFVALQQLAPVISTFVSDLIPLIGDVISAVLPIIGEIIPVVTPIISMVTEIISALLPALSAVLQFLMPIFKTVASIITDVLGNAIEFILPVIQSIIDVLTDLLTFITDVFTGNWEGAWEAIKSVFSGAFEALAGLVKTPLNAVISLINGVISGINKMGFTIPDWIPGLGGKTFKIDVPQIPMLAIGGFTNGPTIAGESGTEAVISFDPAYRNENLSYWAQAGRMLGADGNVIDLLESAAVSPNSGNHNQNYFTFSPNITVTGKETPESFRKILKDEEEEFKDYILELLREKGFTYG